MENIVKLKKCSCGKNLTPQDIKYIGKMEYKKKQKALYLFNCKDCKSTLSLNIKEAA